MEIKETCYKGTRILLGNEKRKIINSMVDILLKEHFQEISLPIIQFENTFAGKVGEENNNLMFTFEDRKRRMLCLAPEYTAVIQKLANTTFKGMKDVKIFYIQECFRGEKPQLGRYRQFTQIGVEVLNPTVDVSIYKNYSIYIPTVALKLIREVVPDLDRTCFTNEVTRGLDYYKEGKGFEITAPELGAQKQICGGGEYDGGVGFAIGLDRLMLMV